jgi:hypothetical protein
MEQLMKQKEIQLGRCYVAKVSGNLTRVRIDSESIHGGWNGINMETNRFEYQPAIKAENKQSGQGSASGAHISQEPPQTTPTSNGNANKAQS